MSIINESMDYSNALLTWKLPPKKCIELKTTNSVDILVAGSQQNNVQDHHNGMHLQENVIQKQHFTHYTSIPGQHLPSQPGMIISHIPNHFSGNIQIQQLKPNENIHIQQVIPISTQNVIQVSNEPIVTNDPPPKEKNIIKKKIKKIPVDGIAFHSKQLGLKVPPKKTLGIKGKVIHRQTREVIHNVYKFMKDEARNGTKIPLANYRERVLAATGISKCTYSKITSKEFINGVLVEAFIPAKKIRKDIKINESAMDQSVGENTSIYRPKINRDASTRDDVYNLEDLVPSHIFNSLQAEAINVINSGDLSKFVAFVGSNMGTILRSETSQEVMIRKISIFLYIEYLIRFINTPMKNVTKKFVVCDKSVEVNNHILDTFSVNSPNGRTRPVHMKDKSLCFILILTAKAMDYEVDLTNLAKDCKIGVKKALEISRILAFNTSSKNKNVVTLKLPLPAPVTVTPKRRK